MIKYVNIFLIDNTIKSYAINMEIIFDDCIINAV